MKRRRLFGASGALAALTVIPGCGGSLSGGNVAPALRALMVTQPSALLPVIVEMQPTPLAGANVTLANQALDLLRAYGVPVAALPLVNSAAGFADAAAIDLIGALPAVAFVHPDLTVGPRQTSAPPPIPAGPPSSVYVQGVRAKQVLQSGISGSGVTVAVLDSGVASDPDLGNRILASVNFADPRTAQDPGGHGTHVAGIIAGDGTRSNGEFGGIAPQAGIVDVRVLGASGSGRVSSVVRGIEWVLAHRSAYNIRVINLSFGAPAPASYRADPFSAAVEIAWRRGLAVVVAAGNGGPGRDTVLTPGIDPYVITVGATDDRGTVGRDDDVFAWFSAWGGSNPKPDLVAPGRRLVSLRVPGSTLDSLYPSRVVAAQNGATYFQLTGTSMSTGVVSGAAALALQRRSSVTPDQLKALLAGTTRSYGTAGATGVPDPAADGSGLLDARAADQQLQQALFLPSANGGLRPADGFARALYPVLYGSPLRWKNPLLGGILWNLLTWSTLTWSSVAWDNFDWDSVAWDSVAWDSVAWDSVAWDSVAWDSVAWDSVAWDSYTLD